MRRAVLSLSALWWLSSACAGDKPELGPVPPWVELRPVPADDGTDSEAAVKCLLSDWQVRFSGATVEAYYHSVLRIQTSQGLSGLGTISLPWNPATDSLMVHQLRILRGGQSIDVLAGGQTFTVLRRENSLEYATLNGLLTAVIQPPGLQVGDVLDMAFTLVRSIPVLGGNSEWVVSGWPTMPISHLRFRGSWTAPTSMQWWASDAMPRVQPVRHGDTTEVAIELERPAAVALPDSAPSRFRIGRELQFSSFKSWRQVAEQLAPLYVQAATLSPQSPLHEEISRIRAATPDPGARVMAALALVQDQVRYVFLGMNDGALVPADADLTWSRRFGDCKGKTALLLALLRELGVPAEPVAVNLLAGDRVKSGLPMIEAFDHVLVRATVEGKIYWLDGTHSGDRLLGELNLPPYYWGLPLVPKGDLVQIVPTALAQPLEEVAFTIDASGGIPGSEPLHATTVFRGQAGALMRYTLGNLSDADRDKLLRAIWTKVFAAGKLDHVEARFDEQTAQEQLTMDGSIPLDWSGEHLELEGLQISYRANLKRDPGPHADAPFRVLFPTYSRVLETIKLPHTAAPFTVDGELVHRTVAGVEFKREAHVQDDVLRAEVSARSLMPEIPFAGSADAQQDMTSLVGATFYLHAPPGYVAQQTAQPANSASPLAAAPPDIPPAPPTGAELTRHGNELLNKGQYDQAIAEFDKALQSTPRYALALAERGMALYWKHAYELARQDFDAAAAIDPHNAVVMRGRGLLAIEARNVAEAVADFSESLRLQPDNAPTLQWRALAYHMSGNDEQALSDAAAAIRLWPKYLHEYQYRGVLLAQLGRPAEAVQEADAVVTANPDNSGAYVTAAAIYKAAGKYDDAMRSLERSLAVAPTAHAYVVRATYRTKSDLAGRQADVDAALKLDARSSAAMIQLASLQSDTGKYADAEATLTQGIALSGDTADLLIQRGIVYAHSAQPQRAAQDFAAVRSKTNDSEDLNKMCWNLATEGVALDTALSACDAAIAQLPDGQYLDSRGLVLLRLGRYEDAIASYDAALKGTPGRSMSLYGRGLAKRLKGDTGAGDADLKAALELNAHAATAYADMGITP
jgi:tetratricopeptide (TPR) repeat protein